MPLTRGERLYLIAGVAMGQSGSVSGGSQGRVLVAAGRDFRFVEVVRRSLPDGEYEVLTRWDDPGKLLDATFEDEPAQGKTTLYYLRGELQEKTRGRPVRVWSSPIWLKGKEDV